MRAKSAVLLVLFTLSVPAYPQLVGIQDTSAIGVAAGSGMYIYGDVRLKELELKMKAEAMSFEAEISQQNSQIKSLLEEAKTIEVGKPNPQSRSLYTGKFVEASAYDQFAGEQKQMSSNSYRLQGSGAERVGAALLEEQELKGKNIRLVLHRVNGTLDGSIRMGSSTELRGSVESVTKELIEAAKAQSATSAPGSIVRVELNYETAGTPNPQAAEKLRAKAGTIQKQVTEKSPKVAEEVAKVEKKYAASIKRMKTLKYGGPAVVVGSILFGFVRYSFAQEMINLSQACDDADRLNTLTTTISVQTELNEDDVAYDLREICSK